jgi:hypothetical protein
MAVTRDPNYPVEMAQLMQAFNMAADGYSANVVLNAAIQLVAAGIGIIAKDQGLQHQQALDYADHITSIIKAVVDDNWERKPSATDVEVKPS